MARSWLHGICVTNSTSTIVSMRYLVMRSCDEQVSSRSSSGPCPDLSALAPSHSYATYALTKMVWVASMIRAGPATSSPISKCSNSKTGVSTRDPLPIPGGLTKTSWRLDTFPPLVVSVVASTGDVSRVLISSKT